MKWHVQNSRLKDLSTITNDMDDDGRVSALACSRVNSDKLDICIGNNGREAMAPIRWQRCNRGGDTGRQWQTVATVWCETVDIRINYGELELNVWGRWWYFIGITERA